MPMTPVLVNLNPLQLEQLSQMTSRTGAPRAALIRMALDKFLAEADPPQVSPAALIALAQIAGLR